MLRGSHRFPLGRSISSSNQGAAKHSRPHITPSARNAAISPSVTPKTPLKTSSVCCPNKGAGPRNSTGVAENRSGELATVCRPATGCSSSTIISRAATCSSPKTCSTSHNGPLGTPAAASMAHHSSTVFSASTRSNTGSKSAWFSVRSALLAKRGSSANAPKPKASQS